MSDPLVLAAHDDDYDPGPYVCPGCYAIGAEPHAGYCPDAAIELDREQRYEREGYEDRDEDEDVP